MRMAALLLAPAFAAQSLAAQAPPAASLQPVYDQIRARHGEAVKRLQDWIALPSIAAEGLNSEAGVERMMALLKEALVIGSLLA